jgi:hypothetical protein
VLVDSSAIDKRRMTAAHVERRQEVTSPKALGTELRPREL